MPFRREEYPETGTQDMPWLDRPDASEAIERRLGAGEIDTAQAEILRAWVRDGYVVLPDVLEDSLIDAINAEVQAIIDAHGEQPIAEYKGEFVNLFLKSEPVKQAMCSPRLYQWLDLILGRRALPFQTLNMPVSSQQGTHSDEILMTTHPPGFLIAAWYALEDITDDCGPLKVYPGSHRLPYVGAREVGIPAGASNAECGRIYDENYYGLMERHVLEQKLEPRTYLAKRGSALLWHSNLMHGAHPCERADATRKSLIVHYFGEGVEHYSDLFQRACPERQLR